jgi:hypothetical protein
MKNLQQHKEEFMRQASEFDTGKKEEDFHSYLRHHNLEHHLSQTQIQDRQMNSNGLNAMGLVAGIAAPLTLGAIFGLQKLTNDNMVGHGAYREPLIRDIDSLTNNIIEYPNTAPESLSGHNTRAMPTAPANVNDDIYNSVGFIPYPAGYVPSHKEAVDNAVKIGKSVLSGNAGLFPPTSN